MCLNAVKPRRYFTTLTTRAAGPLVVDEGAARRLYVCVCVACVSLRSNKLAACCTLDGGICRFCSRGTAWPYSFNGADCYCGRQQQNVKIAGAVDDATGARPTGFMAVSGDTKVLIPGDHKVGSQSKHCGVSPVHKMQSASFSHRRRGFQTLPPTRDRAPVGTHLLIVPLKDLLNYALPYSQG